MPGDDPTLNPLCDADPLARALARLAPVPAAIDADRLLYLAGKAAQERTITFWQRTVIAQFVLFIGIGGGVTAYLSSAESPGQRASDGPAPTAPVRVTPTSPELSEPTASGEIAIAPDPEAIRDYLRQRREVLTAGLGVLPGTSPPPNAPVRTGDLEKSLSLPPGVLTAPYSPPPKEPKPE